MADTNDLLEHRVRERAFQLWQEAGCPEDRAEEFWYRARQAEDDAGGGEDQFETTSAYEPPTGDTQNFA